MPQKIGLLAAGEVDPKLAGELTVDGHEVTVTIYREDGENEIFTGRFSPEIALSPGWQAQGGAAGSAT